MSQQIHAKALRTQGRVSLAQRVLRAITASVERRRERVLLSRLDPHLLSDIGLTPDEARTEWAKPFWQP